MAVNEKPIIFSGPMVYAIRAGKKNQTRRVIKPQPVQARDDFGDFMKLKGFEADFPGDLDWLIENACPYGKRGSRLWVRETWTKDGCIEGFYAYRADGEAPKHIHPKWRPAIHMPRVAARIILQITDVRVERLQDISEEDAIAEGADLPGAGWGTHRMGFELLWEEIKGPGSWDENPWVWVISFARAEA